MKIIVGNWKMNGTRTELRKMLRKLGETQTKNRIILCPPFTMLGVKSDKIALGAQDVSAHDHGAFTGQISARMLREMGVKYAIIGHSECRKYHHDTNKIVHDKATTALSVGITPIICVGETMTECRTNKTAQVVSSGVLESVPQNLGPVIVAYEPRWAIGNNITPRAQEIASVHKLIAKTLAKMNMSGTPILYGGSVNTTNAAQIMSLANVDGVLVGGASLKSDTFIPIITSAR